MPANYPQIPLPSYETSIEFLPTVLRTPDGDAGRVDQVKESDAFLWQVSATWSLSGIELEIFENWFRNDLFFGSKLFTMEFPFGIGLQEAPFEFAEGRYEVNQTGFLFFRVTATLRTAFLPDLVDLEDYAMRITSFESLGVAHTEALSVQLQVAGTRTGPVIFDVNEPTQLPSWLTVSQSGLISGTAPVTGKYRITSYDQIRASKGSEVNTTLKTFAGAGSQTFTAVGLPEFLSLSSLGVLTGDVPVDDLEIVNSVMPEAVFNAQIRVKINSKGGRRPHTYSETGLPTGLSLTAQGVLSGSLPVESTSALRIVNAAGQLPDGFYSRSYSLRLFTFGGKKTVTFAVTPGSLPTGLTLDANTGFITGTPTL